MDKPKTKRFLKDNVINSNTNGNSNNMQHKHLTSSSDASNASFSSASVAGSIQDDLNDRCGLTMAGLEEYNREEYNIRASSYYDQPALFHHQKQSSYAQSEGYHSYVSSSDSSSATPFLDRLRQESELLSRQSHHWSQNDISSLSSNSVAPSPTPLSLLSSNGRDSRASLEGLLQHNHHHNHHIQPQNNSSESTSSTETLKWLGSMSDVSEVSHATGFSNLSESVSSSQLIVHSSRVLTPKRHHSESVLYLHSEQHQPAANSQTSPSQSEPSPPLSIHRPSPNHRHNTSYPPVHCSLNAPSYQQYKSTSSIALESFASDNLGEIQETSNEADEAEAVDGNGDLQNSYRRNHRLFPVSTYTEPVHSNTSQYVLHPKPQFSSGLQKPLQQQQQPTTSLLPNSSNSPTTSSSKLSAAQNSAQANWQSVAELINDFERSNDQPEKSQKYAFIEPSKTHRISNPALKAFQKNAVQSYFERQQQQQHPRSATHSKENNQSLSYQQSQVLRPHSFQPAASVKELTGQQLMRNSLPNNAPLHFQAMPKLTNESSEDSKQNTLGIAHNKPPSPAPPPPPPRSRSLMPSLLRRSSSASDYAEFREHYRGSHPANSTTQAIKNISQSEKLSFNDNGMPPPPPPPRGGRPSMPVQRRTSAASEFAAMREKVLLQKAAALTHQQYHPHQYQQPTNRGHHYYSPLAAVNQAAPAGWVPERPPKNPNMRVPSPDLPPPPSSDADTSLSDEPLPPPPPEILHRQPLSNSYYDSEVESSTKPTSPNRRNSFAGSSTRKTYFGRYASTAAQQEITAKPTAKPPPPAVPKKPSSLELLHNSRHSSSRSHKVVLNGAASTTPSIVPSQSTASFNKIGANRKRPHNVVAATVSPNIINVAPIMEHCSNMDNLISSSSNTKTSPPPPLMPRMLTATATGLALHNNNNSSSNNNKTRSNSKASYLPRQSLEKLNNTDPDHGSYKLTLNSNEDLVTSTKPSSYDILGVHNGKLPNNLPDVLPLGAKLQSQPSSPSSPGNGPAIMYGSNNNLSYSNNKSSSCNPLYPSQHRYSSPAMPATYHSNNSSYAANYLRSQSLELNNSNNKFMSQSSIDLKKPHNLEPMPEEVTTPLPEVPNVLSPAQSENNLSSPTKVKPPSPRTARKEFHNSDANVQQRISAEDSGRVFRAELVNTTLSTGGGSAHKLVTRKDSLRENIEKITQLQSKLMSAHLSDNGVMGVYATKSNTTAHQALVQAAESNSDKQPNSKLDEENHQEKEVSEEKNTTTDLESCDNINESKTETNPLSQMDSDTDGLKLVQRSELILCISSNRTSTAEAASQTDDLLDSEMDHQLNNSKDEPMPAMQRNNLQPRQCHALEIECEEKIKELLGLLQTQDKLVEILAVPSVKTVADYVGSLYNSQLPLRLAAKRDVGTSTLMRMKSKAETKELENNSNVELHCNEVEVTFCNGSEEQDDGYVLKRKMNELVRHMKRKLRVLHNEQRSLKEEAAVNDELSNLLQEKLSNKEASKFRTYIDDVGYITSLLLSLSERLVRAENCLSNLQPESADAKSWESKRDRLLEQLEEAKRLRSDIDRRGGSVSGMLEKNLSNEEVADFDYFINMKIKLIADAREVADKIKRGEEQLDALSETLTQSDC